MSIEELDNFLGRRGMYLSYVRRSFGYHWVVNRQGEQAAEVTVGAGIDPDEGRMIGHILATPLPESGVLIGQLPFDFGPGAWPGVP